MPKTRAGWKRYELQVARMLGAARIPVTGRTGPKGDPGDVLLPGWYVEVRDRRRPQLATWWREVVFEGTWTNTRPLLVAKVPGARGGPVAVLRLVDLAEVMHDAGFARPAGPAAGAQGRAPAGAGGDVARDRPLTRGRAGTPQAGRRGY